MPGVYFDISRFVNIFDAKFHQGAKYFLLQAQIWPTGRCLFTAAV